MGNEKKFFGYKAAIGAFLIIFANLGACTTLGTFLASLSAYSEHSLGAVGQIGTVNTICNIILSVVAIKALGKLGPKKTMLISILACALHMQFYTFATPGANAQSLIFMYIAGGLASFAITFGTHGSMFSTDCRLVCRETCKDNRICIIRCRNRRSSLGISGRTVVQDYRLQELLPYYVSAGTGTWIVCSFLPDQNTGRSGTEAIGMGNSAGSAGNTADVPGVSYKDALKSSTFKFLVVGLLFTSFGGTVFLSYAPSWWQMNGMSATGAANWNAIYLLLAGGLLLVAGTISEKLGTKGFVFYVCVAYVLTFICMVVWPATGGAVYMMVLTVIFGAAAYPGKCQYPVICRNSSFWTKRVWSDIRNSDDRSIYRTGNRFTDYGSYFTDSWRYGTWMENLCNSSGGWHGVPPGST